MLRCFNYILLLSLIFCVRVKAQTTDTSWTSRNRGYPVKEIYFNGGFDAGLFQVASILSYDRSKLSVLRFSYVGNIGVNMNYDFTRHFGLFTGLGVKNIGFIDKAGDSTIKRRVYAVGVPLGIKIGNFSKRRYAMAGGGIDIPVHYKEKGFVNRGDKKKATEWLSDKPTPVMPYVFFGLTMTPGITLKLQFYTVNFLQSSYTGPNYSAKLMYLSLGINPGLKMPGSKRNKDVPKKVM